MGITVNLSINHYNYFFILMTRHFVLYSVFNCFNIQWLICFFFVCRCAPGRHAKITCVSFILLCSVSVVCSKSYVEGNAGCVSWCPGTWSYNGDVSGGGRWKGHRHRRCDVATFLSSLPCTTVLEPNLYLRTIIRTSVEKNMNLTCMTLD